MSFFKRELFKIRVPLTSNRGAWVCLLSRRVQCAPHIEYIETISIALILIGLDGK